MSSVGRETGCRDPGLTICRAEHMEPDEADATFPPWVSLEYSQMIKVAAPAGSRVLFSSLSPASTSSLSTLLTAKGAHAAAFKTDSRTVLQLMQLEGVDLSRVCLLDPRAEKEIAPEDADEFDWFLCVLERECPCAGAKANAVIAGLAASWATTRHEVRPLLPRRPLGRADRLPDADRTGELRKLGFPTRHLGPVQMTTDTALAVTKICVQDKSALRVPAPLRHLD